MPRALGLIMLSALAYAELLPLRFVGNDQISTKQLYESLNLYVPSAIEIWEKPPAIDPVSLSQTLSALNSFYRSKGFYHARIDGQAANDAITVTITENRPVTVETVQVNSPLDVDSAIALESGERFDQEKFSETKSALKKRYAEAGYCNANFNTKAWVDIETDQAHLLFEATPGELCTFGKIAVETTPNIDGNLTAGMLRFKEGDPYSVEAIRQSYEALYAQEGITRVTINDTLREGNSVPITLNIDEEEQPIRFSAGLGYSSDQGITAQTGVKHRNFFGNLKTLALNAKYSDIKQEASGVLTMPLENGYLLGSETGYKNEIFDGYKTASTYEQISAKYQNRPVSVVGGILFDSVRTYDSSDLVTFPKSAIFLSSPFGEFNYDTRNKPLEPTKGYWFNARLSGSQKLPALSEATYFKSLLSGAYLTSIDEQVFGVKLKWGTLRVYDGIVPSSYRFYAGGMNSNRAYTYRDLGPKNSNGDPVGFLSLVEGSFEYRFPIYEAFRGVLFTDFTFASDRYIPNYATDAYYGVGVGLRYVTPVGPIAIDVGVDPGDTSQYALHFRIGELF